MILSILLAVLVSSPDTGMNDSLPDSSSRVTLESISYSADSLLFLPSGEVLFLVGEVTIDYRDMTLRADTVKYDAEAGVIVSRGESELFERGESIRGTTMIYDVETRKGHIIQAASRYDAGFYTGSSITRVGRNEFNITDARFTTCDYTPPHYHFYCPVLKVFPDDKAVAKPVYMFVKNTPVFYFPYWIFPIRRGRQPGFTMPKLGRTGRDGRFLREAGYYFVFSDYADLWLHGDIMEKTRFVLAADERHKLRYVCNGGTKAEWRREFRNKRDRWMFFGHHLHDFPDGTSLRLQGEFLSDRSYLEETQQNPEDRMTGEVSSWFSVNRHFGRLAVQAAVSRTSYLHTDPDTIPGETEVVQEAPDIRFSLPSAPLLHIPSDPDRRRPWHSLYWNLSAHYLARDVQMEEFRATNSAFRLASGLTSSQRAWGWLTLSQYLSASGTVFDRDRNGNRFPWWIHGSTGISASTEIYGIFGGGLLGMNALRHTVSPEVTLHYAPNTYLSEDGAASTDSTYLEYYTFADFGPPEGSKLLVLSLSNTLEGKKILRRRVSKFDLASLDITTTMNLSESDKPFSPLCATLGLKPIQAVSLTGTGSWDPYRREFTDLSLSTGFKLSGYDGTLFPDSGALEPGLPLRLSLSHFYRHPLGDSPAVSKLKFRVSLDVTPGWSIEYNAYYDLLNGGFINQSYTLRRELHCWEAVFVRHISEIDSGFYFKINIVDLPDIKIEQHVSSF